MLAIVVANESPLSSLSLHDLKRIYLGEPVAGPDGNTLLPIAHSKSSRDRLGFDEVVLGMSAEAAARYWIDRRIRGQSGPPKSVDSGEKLQRVVRAINGAIGYVRFAEVQRDVKILRVDGLLPNQLGYKVAY